MAWIQSLRRWSEPATVDSIADELNIDKESILSSPTLLEKLCKHDDRAARAGRLLREYVQRGTQSISSELQRDLGCSDFATLCFLRLHEHVLKPLSRPAQTDACRKVCFSGPLILFANHLELS